MTVYSNKLSVNVNSNTVSNTGLEITNYNVSVKCPGVDGSHSIRVRGTVLYNGNPVPSVPVDIGFCSDFDPTTYTLSTYSSVLTDLNGNFNLNKMKTDPPPGSGICIVAVVSYNNMYAYKEMNVTIPWC
jgi:hypothetical protein